MKKLALFLLLLSFLNIGIACESFWQRTSDIAKSSAPVVGELIPPPWGQIAQLVLNGIAMGAAALAANSAGTAASTADKAHTLATATHALITSGNLPVTVVSSSPSVSLATPTVPPAV